MLRNKFSARQWIRLEISGANRFHVGEVNASSPELFSPQSASIRQRRAMNTLFEIVVSGNDRENQIAAAESALDEISRIENVLSRFDSSSEVSRVNRDAHRQPVLLSHELFEILSACKRFWMETDGYFDITARANSGEQLSGFDAILLNEDTRRISFLHPNVRLDFGAFGKGYALDCAAEIMRENGVENALMHGGTSSVLAFGEAMRVGVKNPWNDAEELNLVLLENAGLSTSATFHPDRPESDIINPHEGMILGHDAACVVMASSAAEAEVFSTALLCMGKERAAEFSREDSSSRKRVFWIERMDGQARIETLRNDLLKKTFNQRDANFLVRPRRLLSLQVLRPSQRSNANGFALR